MRDPESPLARDFWCGTTDARPAALFRISLGLILLVDVFDRLRDFHAFYTDGGILPRALPVPGGGSSIFHLSGSPGVVAALYAGGVLAVLAFTLGLYTRLATALSWLFVHSLMVRAPYVSNGGDMVVRLLLFWGLFADLGAVWSLDVRLRRRSARPRIPVLPLRVMQLQIAFIYLVAAVLKLHSSPWLEGWAVEMSCDALSWVRPTARWLAAHPWLCFGLTLYTITAELLFAPLAFFPSRGGWTRAVALLSCLGLHAGIFLTMRVGIFSAVMPVSYLVFLHPAWVSRLLGSTPAAAPPPSRGRLLGPLALALFVFACTPQLWTMIAKRPGPAWLSDATVRLGLGHQTWQMFVPPPSVNVFWSGPGRLADGRSVDAVAELVPQLRRQHGWVHSRWSKIEGMLQVGEPGLVESFGRYVCRLAQARGLALERFELHGDAVSIALFGARPERKQSLLLTQPCRAPLDLRGEPGPL